MDGDDDMDDNSDNDMPPLAPIHDPYPSEGKDNVVLTVDHIPDAKNGIPYMGETSSYKPEERHYEFQKASNVVRQKLPTVQWTTARDVMKACVKAMLPNEKNAEVIAFCRECVGQILHVMVGLNSIEGSPQTMTQMREMWKKEEIFHKFNMCFVDGIKYAAITIVRIGRVCTLDELKAWTDIPKDASNKKVVSWINVMDMITDSGQHAYNDALGDLLNPNADNPNMLWKGVAQGFFENEGYGMLSGHLDESILQDHSSDKPVDHEHVFHLKIAHILHRLDARGFVNSAQREMRSPSEELVHSTRTRVQKLATAAKDWLKARLAVAPDKLTAYGRKGSGASSDSTEIMNIISGLMIDEDSLELAQDLLKLPNLSAQQLGLRLIAELCRKCTHVQQQHLAGRIDYGRTEIYDSFGSDGVQPPSPEIFAAFETIPGEFLDTMRQRFDGEGDDLVKQLLAAKVLNKRVIVDTFGDLTRMRPQAQYEFEVCQFWGELGLRCMCTADERTRDIGIQLLTALSNDYPNIHAKELLIPAEKAFRWLEDICRHEGLELAKVLDSTKLKEADRLINLFNTLHEVLNTVGSVLMDQIAELWYNTAIRCLRCSDKYVIREIGFNMIDQAINQSNHHVNYNNTYNNRNMNSYHHTSSGMMGRSRLGENLCKMMKETAAVRAFLESIFTEAYAHHAVIRLVSPWLVDKYYKEFCYEDDDVDLMEYLVDAATHDHEGGVFDAVTDLIVSLTVKNISIKSLNSLCNLFKKSVSIKSTAALGNKVILAWIDRTRQKKWVPQVQQRVLDLLWTMLVNKSSEDEEDTEKVLEYFKNQFMNIRGHATESTHRGDDKGSVARTCILNCALKSLAEIKRSNEFMSSGGIITTPSRNSFLAAVDTAATPPPSSGGIVGAVSSAVASGLGLGRTRYSAQSPGGASATSPPISPTSLEPNYADMEPEELRERATQCASLLTIVLDLVNNLRDDVLQQMAHSDEGGGYEGMVRGVFDEIMQAATHDDVDSSAVLTRLRLLSTLSEYLLRECPLTPEMLEQLWEVLEGRHRRVCLRWMAKVLRPPEGLQSDKVYFAGNDGKAARESILGRLSNLIMSGDFDIVESGEDGVDCLLKLFVWVNKDRGAFDENGYTKVVFANARAGSGAAGAKVPSVAHPLNNQIGSNALSASATTAVTIGVDKDDSDTDEESLAIIGDDIMAYSALTVVALDVDLLRAAAAAAASVKAGDGDKELGGLGSRSNSLNNLSTQSSPTSSASQVSAATMNSSTQLIDAASLPGTNYVTPAVKMLLHVSEGIFRAQLGSKSGDAGAQAKNCATGLDGLARYDLVRSVFDRIAGLEAHATDKASAVKVNHWLSVLSQFLQQLSVCNNTVSHRSRALGESMELKINLDLSNFIPTEPIGSRAGTVVTNAGYPTRSSSNAVAVGNSMNDPYGTNSAVVVAPSTVTKITKVISVHASMQLSEVLAIAIRACDPIGAYEETVRHAGPQEVSSTATSASGMPDEDLPLAEIRNARWSLKPFSMLAARKRAARAVAAVKKGVNALSSSSTLDSASGVDASDASGLILHSPNHFRDGFHGPALSLAELGIAGGDTLMLRDSSLVVPVYDMSLNEATGTAGSTRKSSSSSSPSDLLAASDEYMALLFKFLNHPLVCSRAWGVIQMVPTSASMELQLDHLSPAANSTAPDSKDDDRSVSDPLNWHEILGDGEPFWRRVYVCQMVEAALLPAFAFTDPSAPASGKASEQDAVVEWRRSFVSQGGLAALLTLVDGQDLQTMGSLMRSASLESLMRVVNFCITNALVVDETVNESGGMAASSADVILMEASEHGSAESKESSSSPNGGIRTRLGRQFSTTTSNLVKRAIDMTAVVKLLFSVVRVGASTELSDGEVAAVSDAISTITVIVERSEVEAWDAMSEAFPLDVLLRLLLESPVARLRKEAAAVFAELIGFDSQGTLRAGGMSHYTLSAGEGKGQAPALEVLGPLFTERLEKLPLSSSTAGEFFGVWEKIIIAGATQQPQQSKERVSFFNSGANRNWFSAEKMDQLMESKLRQFVKPVIDPCQDTVLVGTLRAYAKLLQTTQQPNRSRTEAFLAKGKKDLIECLFDTFLMRLPLTARPSSVGVGQRFPAVPKHLMGAKHSGPICGTDDSRKAACLLLRHATDVSPSSGSEADATSLRHFLSSLMGAFAKEANVPSDRMLCRAGEDIKEFARPGLVNTANRCYMNSLCQQMTALLPFSRGILSTPIPETVFEADAEEEAARKAEEEKKKKGGGADEPTQGTWNCPTCTFENDVSLRECDMCGSGRPANVKINVPGVSLQDAHRERVNKAKAQKAVLREFQRTLRFLTNGEMAYYDNVKLLETVGRHLALQFPAEQQNDVHEFLTKLLEQLEMELGDTVHKDLVKDIFGATTAELKVRQHDKKLINRNLKTTTTYLLDVKVEGIGSLEEGLEKTFAEDIREVDDEDEIDDDGKPVKHKFEYTEKFVDLPKALCIQLSRFGFDYSRGIGVKYNHRVEFPEELDMARYVDQTSSSSSFEAKAGNSEGTSSSGTSNGSPKASTLYRLRGVLVHMGASANQGHYYSIIRPGDLTDSSNVFLNFNDMHVSKANSIEDECFGGGRAQATGKSSGRMDTITTTAYGNTYHQNMDRSNNAYLLFYERADSGVLNTDATKNEGGGDDIVGEATAKMAAMSTSEVKGTDDASVNNMDSIRCAQERDVQRANEDLWRRKLLYQQPVLEMHHSILSDFAKKRRRPASGGTTQQRWQIAAGEMAEHAFAVYDHAALHMESLVNDRPSDIIKWATVVLRLFRANPHSAAKFLHAVARGEEIKAKGQEVPNDSKGSSKSSSKVKSGGWRGGNGNGAPGEWDPVPFISQNIIQDGVRFAEKAVRESAVKVFAGAADVVARSGGNLEPLIAVLGRQLRKTMSVYQESSYLDGYVLVFLELAMFPSLRPLLRRLDVPAFLVNIYLNALSPAQDYLETEPGCLAASTGERLPKLSSNLRRSANAYVNQLQPIHDFKVLLRALARILSNQSAANVAMDQEKGKNVGAAAAVEKNSEEDAEDLAADAEALSEALAFVPSDSGDRLPQLTMRLLQEHPFLSEVVEKNPTGGIIPVPQPKMSAEEEDAALAAEGWRHVPSLQGGRGHWTRMGLKNSYEHEKPKPRKKTEAELEDLAMEPTNLKAYELLLVQLALLGPAISDEIVEALLSSLELKGFPSHRPTTQRVKVLMLLLQCDDDGMQQRRVLQVAQGLDDRITVLRDSPDRRQKQHVICARMEVLIQCAQEVHRQDREEGNNVLAGDSQLCDFSWYPVWRSQRQLDRAITLKTLQGRWRNDQDQDVDVKSNMCTFAKAVEPVEIEVDDYGSFKVPGWILLQEQSSPTSIVWGSTEGSNNRTIWRRYSANINSVFDPGSGNTAYGQRNGAVYNTNSTYINHSHHTHTV